MSVPFYTEIANKAKLDKAFYLLYSKSSIDSRLHVSGIDGMTLEEFRSKKSYYINQLYLKLRSRKGYKFSELFAFPVPKKEKGKYRIISIPTVNDRIVQKAIVEYLSYKHGKFNQFNFGFVNDSNVKVAVEKAVSLRSRYQYAIKTDITKFFDNIDRGLMKKSILNRIKAKSIHELLLRIINCEIAAPESQWLSNIIINNGIIKGKGLRQGMPLSPLLSNVFMDPFDQFFLNKEVPAVRYADDLIFFATSQKKARQILKLCKEQLDELNLKVPDLSTKLTLTKTTICSPSKPVEFLGVTIEKNKETGEYEVTLSKDQIEKIKESIDHFKDVDKYMSKGQTIDKIIKNIKSSEASYNANYKDVCNEKSKQKLKDSLHDHINGLVIFLYKQAGIDIGSLNKRGKKLLLGW